MANAGTGAGGVTLGEERTFTFDHCLWSVRGEDENYAGQDRLYEVLGEEFLQHSLEGYNCCIFACISQISVPSPSLFNFFSLAVFISDNWC